LIKIVLHLFPKLMKKLLLLLLFSSNYIYSQVLTFETLEKVSGKYYTDIQASLLINQFELLSIDNASKKLTYQYIPKDNSDIGNKFCYIWRNDDDKAETITYFTTNLKEFINWKKALLIKNYKSKPLVKEGSDTKEWFYTKNILVKILHKQLPATNGNTIDAYLITFIKKK